MSLTATTTADAATLLADYDIHRSPAPHINPTTRPNTIHQKQQKRMVENPPYWPTDYHRVPPHRPINRELDQSQRAVYQNRAEQAFVNVMLSGVWTNAVSNCWKQNEQFRTGFDDDVCDFGLLLEYRTSLASDRREDQQRDLSV
ncbi:hypothetical protein FQN52_003785 [Onygenales sp. PD_12]|nr:hypothetical protein FQN53_007969 [Emmonsiellopsis sp. PD_33]KAK2792308.1 hypothetical protein FQN52_003785 [Onygenales sp. PD_12]